jgi:hypothetical protein
MVTASSGPLGKFPALLTRMSRRPKAATVRSTAPITASEEALSAPIARPRRPVPSISATTALARSALLA